jgi:hypothetical protein
MKTLLVVLGLLIVAAILVAMRSGNEQVSQHTSVVPMANSEPHSHDGMGMGDYAVTGRIPAHYETAPTAGTLSPTLSPEMFVGNKRLGYQAAKGIPEVLAQLPCYCHCDRGHGHKSLHSCFESEHGENCGICIGEAIMAQSLHKSGRTDKEIREQIIAAYGSTQNVNN